VKLLVQIENSKTADWFILEITDESQGASPRVLGDRMRTWLARAVNIAISSRVCTSFVVSVHRLDSACDHEHRG
jgi:hypothetical protein